jgi:S-adenosylmethionine-diacylglycerol 3-amino-3-carboxypropyl transferase
MNARLETVGPRQSYVERTIFSGIVFGMNWEDPEVDRRALQVTRDDTVLAITSAGCNALNLLLEGPARLVCVDANPAQTALLELKLAAIASLDHRTVSDIFGGFCPARIHEVYRPHLRPMLSPAAKRFWDRHTQIVADNIHRRGKMGTFMRLVRAYLRWVGLGASQIQPFLDIANLCEQRLWYARHIAPRLWSSRALRLLCSRPLMYLAGMHPAQLSRLGSVEDVFQAARLRIEHLLLDVPIWNNYFVSVAATGAFRDRERVPPWLRTEHFAKLKSQIGRVELRTERLEAFLNRTPGPSISKFNLLDIFDWMSRRELDDCFESIARKAAPNARLIYRSTASAFEPPPAAHDRFRIERGLSTALLRKERSGTHGSLYVLAAKSEPVRGLEGKRRSRRLRARP